MQVLFFIFYSSKKHGFCCWVLLRSQDSLQTMVQALHVSTVKGKINVQSEIKVKRSDYSYFPGAGKRKSTKCSKVLILKLSGQRIITREKCRNQNQEVNEG
ncbi:hypothetical protein GDO78_004173 [Eleutherodactylus coqui]|uniref:Uncharacterized protein n=1 Tax=Eleutherodactylus coqui TaxID=57060 RepID=A0A8J6ERK2_ELECQ|nr:hypothetical protein GDO78_004173 [Eleutherodactylus coqui]